jgi:hypothetical protein
MGRSSGWAPEPVQRFGLLAPWAVGDDDNHSAYSDLGPSSEKELYQSGSSRQQEPNWLFKQRDLIQGIACIGTLKSEKTI